MRIFRKNRLFYWVLAPFLMLLSSCGNNSLLDSTLQVDGHWPKTDTVQFKVDVLDTVQAYSFYLNIRNSSRYRYSNLYLFMKTHFPNGNVTHDTIEVVLANPQGKWLGKGWGELHENHIMLKDNLRFPLKGPYQFMIVQAMRRDTLKGIQDVGIQITPAK